MVVELFHTPTLPLKGRLTRAVSRSLAADPPEFVQRTAQTISQVSGRHINTPCVLFFSLIILKFIAACRARMFKRSRRSRTLFKKSRHMAVTLLNDILGLPSLSATKVSTMTFFCHLPFSSRDSLRYIVRQGVSGSHNDYLCHFLKTVICVPHIPLI